MTYFLKSFTLALAAALTAQTKVAVVYGDEGFERSVESGPFVQVLEDSAGDVFNKAPTTQGGSSPTRFRKQVGILIKIKGASSKPGATVADHRGVVDAIADLVVIAVEEISHAHKQTIESITGSPNSDTPDESAPNAASAYYQLKFKWLRGVNKEKSIATLSGLLPASEILAHRMVIAPTDGAAITAFASDIATVSGLAGIDASFVGKTLTLDGGASAGNRGDFPIATVIDDTSVTIMNPNASIDSGLTWAVSDDEPAELS